MDYLNINNLKIDNYIINCIIESNLCYGVISTSENIKNKFLLTIAGINSNNSSCQYLGNDIFDNKEYFSNRVYLDFKKKYFRTLNSEYIEKTMKERFGISFDGKRFKDTVASCNLRSEVLVTDEYKFTQHGINVCGFCLLKGLDFPNIIINNPIYKIRSEVIKKQIANYITNKKNFNSMIIDATNWFDFKDLIDRFIIFGDYNDVIVCDPLKDKFIVTDDNIQLRNRIFKKGHMVVCLNDYDKKEMKVIKQKYKLLTFYEMIKLIFEDFKS